MMSKFEIRGGLKIAEPNVYFLKIFKNLKTQLQGFEIFHKKVVTCCADDFFSKPLLFVLSRREQEKKITIANLSKVQSILSIEFQKNFRI